MKLLPANLVAAGRSGHEHHGHNDEGTQARTTARHDGTARSITTRHGDAANDTANTREGHDHQYGHHGTTPASRARHDAAQGIEWEDDMLEVNRMTTPANMRWKLVDRETGAENAQIDWTFHVGDQVKLRLVNEMDSDHPMPHPFHVHGAGRFLILARDDVVEPNLVWKDTVLVRTGETVDILLDVTNPGRWMAHCHIAEHHESGMMFSFNVESFDQVVVLSARSAARRSARSYLTSESSLNIGRYMEMMITPTIIPTPIIISGSMIAVSEAIALSTSSS